MHWLAALLAAAAILIFTLAHFGVARKWITIPGGLALLTAAWMVQVIVASGHHFVIH